MLRRIRTRVAQRMARSGLLATAAGQHVGPPPDLTGTIEYEVSFGTLYLDEADEVITPGLVAVGEWEPGQTALFGAYLRPGMTVVDVGAHVGYFTALAGRLVGPRGLVIAFEPDPRNYELLLANVWRNGLTNVVCFPWAVADQPGFLSLYLADRNTGDHRVYATEEERPSVLVRAVALDTLAVLRPPVDVLKIDVQGAEEAVVRGAEALLTGSPEILVVAEFAPDELRAFGSDERRLLDYYRSLGFGLRVQHPEEKGLRELTDDELLAFCRSETGKSHANLVLTRRPVEIAVR